MILNVTVAEYIEKYIINLTFSNGDSILTDLEETIFSDTRKIFFPLRSIEYFKSFKIRLNTITWDNEADFAPEFLLELGKRQELQQKLAYV
jgi:hypothetical protein